VPRLLQPVRHHRIGDYPLLIVKLIHDVVVPEAKRRNITSVAQVQAAGTVSASPARAVVLVFINQNVTATDSAPADTASTVRMTMTKSGQRWLVSRFDPI
jgi:Mce-associated membrane protein